QPGGATGVHQSSDEPTGTPPSSTVKTRSEVTLAWMIVSAPRATATWASGKSNRLPGVFWSAGGKGRAAGLPGSTHKYDRLAAQSIRSVTRSIRSLEAFGAGWVSATMASDS